MSIQLTKGYVCNTLASVIRQWKHPAAGILPCFCNETWYCECFYFYLSRFPFRNDAPIVPYINQHIENALAIAFRKICKILDQHPADGAKLFELMCEEKFILRRDRTWFNKKVDGKYPKGLKRDEWEEYNHWLLAKLYWQGFLWSQEPGFQIILPNDIDGPVELFLSHSAMPLWGMRINAEQAGHPSIGSYGDCINVRPYAFFEMYFGEK